MALLDMITGVLFRSATPAPKAKGERPEDNRAVVRVPQRMRNGFLWADRLISPRACMIRDISVRGARVDVIGEPIKPSLLADGVRLYLTSEKHEMQCRVAWARGQSFGLRFEGRPRPPSRTYK
jgi:hypothetical protein